MTLHNACIPFETEKQFKVVYADTQCGDFRADIFIDGKIVLELKATDSICRQHEAQVLAYLKASGAELAILMNFGETSLRTKRFAN